MRLASFLRPDGRASFGALADDDRLVELATPEVPTLRRALTDWGRRGLGERVAAGRPLPRPAGLRWLPPITDPDKIVCVGLNYHRHAEEAGMAVPAHPSLFVRFAGSQVGHEERTLRPRASEQYDYEAELALVIGERAHRVPAAEALAVVAGYACFAEHSVRDWQKHSTQATPGKNFRASGAFGPWLTTADEIADPAALEVIGRLNGAEVQRDTVVRMIFGLGPLIAYVSEFAELLPGDVIVTGTPAGVGMAKKPPRWLREGDVFEVDIPGVGLLRNPVADEPISSESRR